MSYTITSTAGATLATIPDGTVNTTTTSLTLIGKNYAGYGIFLNENYVKLLENFSNGTAPFAPMAGQLWYDSNTNVLKVYDGANWKPISSSASGATQPANPVIGDLWWDIVNTQLKVYSGSAWITVGPAYTSSVGTSGAIVETILDSGAGSHIVVKFYVANTVVAIVSKDATFTPQTAIAGFTTIKPGINLVSPSTIVGAQYTGDASNALTVGGIAANQFLRSDQDTSTNYKITAGGGYRVGSDLDMTVGVGAVNFTNITNNSDLNLWVNKGGISTKAIGITGSTGAVTINDAFIANTTAAVTGNLTVTGYSVHQGVTVAHNSILPNANNTIEIGSNATKFANVWATTFRGVAITANYADLAERFEADQPYMPGTVVEIGGLKEITAAIQELSENVFGVISTRAGFLMNGAAGDDVTHPPVAVNGRVPVRVIGKVKKGDRLVSAGRGLARAATKAEINAFNVLGRALADKVTDGEGLVEASVKINN